MTDHRHRHILFWMDSVAGISPKKDTTYALIQGCFDQGLIPYYLDVLAMDNQTLVVVARRFLPVKWGMPLVLDSTPVTMTHHDIGAIWVRKDPPVDDAYRMTLMMLQVVESEVLVLNNPQGLLRYNEKLAAMVAPPYGPSTLVSDDCQTILAFMDRHDTCIIKPLNGYAGQGVFKLKKTDTNTVPIIETMTHRGHVMCQRAVDHTKGDKRIILLNGRILGAVNRVNRSGHRNNFAAGGVAEPATITDHDRDIVDALQATIRNNGLFFVGIDIIDDHLIEVNITSPTGVQEINQLDNSTIHATIIREMITMQSDYYA